MRSSDAAISNIESYYDFILLRIITAANIEGTPMIEKPTLTEKVAEHTPNTPYSPCSPQAAC